MFKMFPSGTAIKIEAVTSISYRAMTDLKRSAKERAVFCYIVNVCCGDDYNDVAEFKTEEEARAYIAELMKELNSDA